MSTLQKTFVLLLCTFLGLICGTLYLYLSYSPQLASRLHYSATDSSSIALLGTLGVAISGPLAGAVVDRRGYSIALVIGGLSILGGYYGLRRQFVAAYSNLTLLCFFLFAIGCGLTFINLACLKCCAVSFPSIRGVATSLPLALYGLLAMFYSVVASMFYPGDTVGFLGFLIMSLVVIFSVCAPNVMLCDRRAARRPAKKEPFELATRTDIGLEKPSELQFHGLHHNSADISGLRLLATPRFWLLFIATGAFALLGQMYIYSVGYMVRALVTSNFKISAELDQIQAVAVLIQKEQQLQVGLLSIANCVGRLVAGVMGDVISQSFHKPRSWLLFVPSLGLVCTQIMGLNVVHHEELGMASMLTGFFYGFTFCIMPIIVGDVFGMDNFSGNWGLVGLSPIIPSFFFTNLFGKVYDSHSVVGENGSTCTLGKDCYGQVFNLTLAVSILAVLVVSVFNFGERYLASRAMFARSQKL